MSDRNIRYSITFHGVVQGVGFRFTARTVAQRYKVKGWARNTRDGKVEVVAEGRDTSLASFLSDIKHQFRNGITHMDLRESKATNEFQKFEIYS